LPEKRRPTVSGDLEDIIRRDRTTVILFVERQGTVEEPDTIRCRSRTGYRHFRVVVRPLPGKGPRCCPRTEDQQRHDQSDPFEYPPFSSQPSHADSLPQDRVLNRRKRRQRSKPSLLALLPPVKLFRRPTREHGWLQSSAGGARDSVAQVSVCLASGGFNSAQRSAFNNQPHVGCGGQAVSHPPQVFIRVIRVRHGESRRARYFVVNKRRRPPRATRGPVSSCSGHGTDEQAAGGAF